VQPIESQLLLTSATFVPLGFGLGALLFAHAATRIPQAGEWATTTRKNASCKFQADSAGPLLAEDCLMRGAYAARSAMQRPTAGDPHCLHNPMRRSPRAGDACKEARPDPQPTLIGNWGMPSCGPTGASVTGGRRAELPVIRDHRVTELNRDLLPDGLGWIGRANALWTSSFSPIVNIAPRKDLSHSTGLLLERLDGGILEHFFEDTLQGLVLLRIC